MNHIEEVLHQETSLTIQNAEIIVDDPASMEIASEMVLELDAMKKKVVDYWAEPKKNAYDSWKSITAKEKEMLDPIDTARDGLRRKINFYLTEQKRKEDEERRKADEKRRAEEEAERQRLAELAKEAEESGDVEAAEVIKEQAEAVYIPPEVPETIVPKTTYTGSGTVSGKKELQVEIRDKKALIEAMIKDNLLEMIEVKEAKLKQWLKLTGKESYPGCGIQETIAASFRGKRSA